MSSDSENAEVHVDKIASESDTTIHESDREESDSSDSEVNFKLEKSSEKKLASESDESQRTSENQSTTTPTDTTSDLNSLFKNFGGNCSFQLLLYGILVTVLILVLSAVLLYYKLGLEPKSTAKAQEKVDTDVVPILPVTEEVLNNKVVLPDPVTVDFNTLSQSSQLLKEPSVNSNCDDCDSVKENTITSTSVTVTVTTSQDSSESELTTSTVTVEKPRPCESDLNFVFSRDRTTAYALLPETNTLIQAVASREGYENAVKALEKLNTDRDSGNFKLVNDYIVPTLERHWWFDNDNSETKSEFPGPYGVLQFKSPPNPQAEFLPGEGSQFFLQQDVLQEELRALTREDFLRLQLKRGANLVELLKVLEESGLVYVNTNDSEESVSEGYRSSSSSCFMDVLRVTSTSRDQNGALTTNVESAESEGTVIFLSFHNLKILDDKNFFYYAKSLLSALSRTHLWLSQSVGQESKLKSSLSQSWQEILTDHREHFEKAYESIIPVDVEKSLMMLKEFNEKVVDYDTKSELIKSELDAEVDNLVSGIRSWIRRVEVCYERKSLNKSPVTGGHKSPTDITNAITVTVTPKKFYSPNAPYCYEQVGRALKNGGNADGTDILLVSRRNVNDVEIEDKPFVLKHFKSSVPDSDNTDSLRTTYRYFLANARAFFLVADLGENKNTNGDESDSKYVRLLDAWWDAELNEGCFVMEYCSERSSNIWMERMGAAAAGDTAAAVTVTTVHQRSFLALNIGKQLFQAVLELFVVKKMFHNDIKTENLGIVRDSKKNLKFHLKLIDPDYATETTVWTSNTNLIYIPGYSESPFQLAPFARITGYYDTNDPHDIALIFLQNLWACCGSIYELLIGGGNVGEELFSMHWEETMFEEEKWELQGGTRPRLRDVMAVKSGDVKEMVKKGSNIIKKRGGSKFLGKLVNCCCCGKRNSTSKQPTADTFMDRLIKLKQYYQKEGIQESPIPRDWRNLKKQQLSNIWLLPRLAVWVHPEPASRWNKYCQQLQCQCQSDPNIELKFPDRPKLQRMDSKPVTEEEKKRLRGVNVVAAFMEQILEWGNALVPDNHKAKSFMEQILEWGNALIVPDNHKAKSKSAKVTVEVVIAELEKVIGKLEEF